MKVSGQLQAAAALSPTEAQPLTITLQARLAQRQFGHFENGKCLLSL